MGEEEGIVENTVTFFQEIWPSGGPRVPPFMPNDCWVNLAKSYLKKVCHVLSLSGYSKRASHDRSQDNSGTDKCPLVGDVPKKQSVPLDEIQRAS